jgi:hypothetical protein
MTGVMEVDTEGRIVGVAEHRMYPPGLLWWVVADTSCLRTLHL